MGEPWGAWGSEQGEQSHGGRERRLFSQAAFLAGSLETRERPGKVSAGATHRISGRRDAEPDLMERRTFRKLMQPSAPRKDRGFFFGGGGGGGGGRSETETLSERAEKRRY